MRSLQSVKHSEDFDEGTLIEDILIIRFALDLGIAFE
jgi:hypothetical protein